MVRTGKPWSIGSGLPFMATASIALRSSLQRRTAGCRRSSRPRRSGARRPRRPGARPTSQQVREPYAAPPGVADQVAADLVGHAVEGDPGLGALAGRAARRRSARSRGRPCRGSAACQSRGSIVGHHDRGVDQVEVVVRRLPRARRPRSPIRTPLGTVGSVTPDSRSSRRVSSTCRRPRPTTRPKPADHRWRRRRPGRPGSGSPPGGRRAGRRPRGRRRRRPSGSSQLCPAQRLGQQRQADQPGGEADGHGQVVSVGRPRLRATATTPTTARTPNTTAGSHHVRRASRPAHANDGAEEDQDHQRSGPACPVTEDRMARSATGPGRQPDDQLGHGHDRRLADRHRHRRRSSWSRARPRRPRCRPATTRRERSSHCPILAQA